MLAALAGGRYCAGKNGHQPNLYLSHEARVYDCGVGPREDRSCIIGPTAPTMSLSSGALKAKPPVCMPHGGFAVNIAGVPWTLEVTALKQTCSRLIFQMMF